MHTKSESNWGIWAIVAGSIAVLVFATMYMGGVFESVPANDVAAPPAIVSPTE